jgi:hypothetical protein
MKKPETKYLSWHCSFKFYNCGEFKTKIENILDGLSITQMGSLGQTS